MSEGAEKSLREREMCQCEGTGNSSSRARGEIHGPGRKEEGMEGEGPMAPVDREVEGGRVEASPQRTPSAGADRQPTAELEARSPGANGWAARGCVR